MPPDPPQNRFKYCALTRHQKTPRSVMYFKSVRLSTPEFNRKLENLGYSVQNSK